MSDLYLHIGYPKTGTSSIQLFLRDNAGALADAGYWVPQAGMGRAGGHHNLVRALAGLPVPPHQAVETDDILEELAGADGRHILISSEMLTGILTDSNQASNLVRKLRSRASRIVLIMYVRNQTQWINSAYSQGVKSFRHAGAFRPYVDDVLGNVKAYSYSKWFEIAKRLNAELRVRPFSKQVRDAGVLPDYLDTAGIARSDSFALPPRVNESAGPFAVEAARRLLEWIPGGANGLTLMQSTRCKLALAREMEAIDIVDGAYCGLDSDLARTVEAAFVEENDRFANAAWGRDWNSEFRQDVGAEFLPNDYGDTGVPVALAGPLDELVSKMKREIGSILSNKRLAVQADWNARRV